MPEKTNPSDCQGVESNDYKTKVFWYFEDFLYNRL